MKILKLDYYKHPKDVNILTRKHIEVITFNSGQATSWSKRLVLSNSKVMEAINLTTVQKTFQDKIIIEEKFKAMNSKQMPPWEKQLFHRENRTICATSLKITFKPHIYKIHLTLSEPMKMKLMQIIWLKMGTYW